MKTFKKNITLILMALFCLTCSEESIEEESINNGTLTGKVVEDGTNTPLENVKVSTNPNSSTVFTDADGNFVINEILVGQYSVQAEIDGYLADFESAEINTGLTTNVIFELQIETANNLPPTTPILISPEDNSTEVPLQTELVWSSNDPEDDEITYSIKIRNDLDNEVLVFETVNDTTLALSNLRFGLKYFWQVGAKDNVNEAEVLSAVSTFETLVSPENRVLFVRQIGENKVIFSGDEEGNELQLTSSNDNSFRPRRNISANKIAYLSNNGAQTHIFTMNLDGSDKQQLTSAVPVNGFNLDEIDFSWTENGGRIIYPNFDRLYALNSDGTGLQEIYQTIDGSFISEVAVNADETGFVLKTNNVSGYDARIFTINNSGTIVDDILSGVPGAAGGIDISVDNNLVLYWYDVSGFESNNYRQLDSKIFVYNRATGESEELSSNKPDGTLDYDCKFSPNEAQIILTNTSNDGLSQKNIVLITTNTVGIFEDRLSLFQNAEMPDFQ